MKQTFDDIADWVSSFMGTPLNIGIWVAIVLVWILLFALHILGPTSNVLPGWFTSNAFNFPLNTVTTLAELYIGFLIAAAANRVKKRNFQIATAVEGEPFSDVLVRIGFSRSKTEARKLLKNKSVSLNWGEVNLDENTKVTFDSSPFSDDGFFYNIMNDPKNPLRLAHIKCGKNRAGLLLGIRRPDEEC